ncbi:MAG: YIP1 family protein [Pseudomonadota bacterium]
MSIALDIVRTYRAPREVQSRQMQAGERSEGRALAVLMGACFLLFVATLPNLSRQAFLDPSIPFQGRMAGSFFAWLLMMPLVFYGLSILLILLLKLLRLNARGHHVRMAMFWALLASSPLWLLSGLAAGFTGESSGTMLSGLAAIGAFGAFTIFGLVAAVRTGQEPAV